MSISDNVWSNVTWNQTQGQYSVAGYNTGVNMYYPYPSSGVTIDTGYTSGWVTSGGINSLVDYPKLTPEQMAKWVEQGLLAAEKRLEFELVHMACQFKEHDDLLAALKNLFYHLYRELG